jgi:hypothetical protein
MTTQRSLLLLLLLVAFSSPRPQLQVLIACCLAFSFFLYDTIIDTALSSQVLALPLPQLPHLMPSLILQVLH